MRICFTGDSIMLIPPKTSYWKDNSLVGMICACDIRCGNLEMVLSGSQAFASTFCGGQWLTTTPDRLDFLAKYGFDYFNTANNHTMDYSYEGIRLTNEALDVRRILHSGSGMSLEEASMPVYIERDSNRVAFISCTASCDDAARAGDPSAHIPPRPGVNMLRHTEKLYVTENNLKMIDYIAEELCVNARFIKSVKMGTHFLSSDIHRLGRLEFSLGSENKKMTYCNKDDLKRIIKSIKRAKDENADIIVICIHSHDIKGMTDDTADYYHEEFAHACIDAGASVIVGTGTHQLKGIEIYHGCPIFYSLGNFIFKEEYMEYAPHDIFERYHVEDDITPQELYKVRTKNGTVGLCRDPLNYRSIIPILEYNESGQLLHLSLIPIELGFDGDMLERGYPTIASNSIAIEIFERLKKLSNEYKTFLHIVDNAIEVGL